MPPTSAMAQYADDLANQNMWSTSNVLPMDSWQCRFLTWNVSPNDPGSRIDLGYSATVTE